jgi:hypothetical protein
VTYADAIAVRKRQLAGQPIDRDDLATANRVIAHQRSMASAFGNESAPLPAPTPPAQPARTPLPTGCISVDEWLRTLSWKDSYQPDAARARPRTPKGRHGNRN